MGFREITDAELDPLPQQQAAPVGVGFREITDAELDPLPEQVEQFTEGTNAERFGRAFVGGASRLIPFGDEIVAGGSALVDRVVSGVPLSAAYDNRLDEVRSYQRGFEDTVGSGVATGVDVGSALMVPSPGLIAKAGTTTGKIAAGATEGAGYGALYGFANAEGQESRLDAARQNALLGGGLGGGIAAMPAAINAGARSLNRAARSYQKEGLGLRTSDIRNINTKAPTYLDAEGNIVSKAEAVEKVAPLDARLNILEEEGLLRHLSNNPATAREQLLAAADDYGAQQRQLVQLADDSLPKGQTITPPPPQWSPATQEFAPFPGRPAQIQGTPPPAPLIQQPTVFTPRDPQRQMVIDARYGQSLDPPPPPIRPERGTLATPTILDNFQYARPESEQPLIQVARAFTGRTADEMAALEQSAAGLDKLSGRVPKSPTPITDYGEAVERVLRQEVPKAPDAIKIAGAKISPDFSRAEEMVQKIEAADPAAARPLRRLLDFHKTKEGMSFSEALEIKRTVGQGAYAVPLSDARGKQLSKMIERAYASSLSDAFEKYAPEAAKGKWAEINRKLDAVLSFTGEKGPLAKRAAQMEQPGRSFLESYFPSAMIAGTGYAMSNPIVAAGMFVPPIVRRVNAKPMSAARTLSSTSKAVKGAAAPFEAVSARGDQVVKAIGQGLSAQPSNLRTTNSSTSTNTNAAPMWPDNASATPSPSNKYVRPISGSSSASLSGDRSQAFLTEVPPAIAPIVQAMIQVESSGNPRARSPKGAEGLMQIMPAMQKAYGVTDPYDPQQSIQAGAAIFSDELDRFGDVALALAAYNAGSPKVMKAIERAGSRDFADVERFLPTETRNYVRKIAAALSANDATLTG